MTGHSTDREVARYTDAADRERLAEQAMDRLEGAEREQELSTRLDGLDKNMGNPLKGRVI